MDMRIDLLNYKGNVAAALQEVSLMEDQDWIVIQHDCLGWGLVRPLTEPLVFPGEQDWPSQGQSVSRATPTRGEAQSESGLDVPIEDL